MRGWGLWLAVAASACAKASDADYLPPPSLGPPPQTSGDDGGAASDGSSSGSSDGAALDATTGAGNDGSGGGGSTGQADATSGPGDASGGVTTGGTPAVCEPVADDDACFMCARDSCCVQLAACDENPVCQCAYQCIQGGGSGNACVDMCGGQNEQTINLLGCAYFNCDAC